MQPAVLAPGEERVELPEGGWVWGRGQWLEDAGACLHACCCQAPPPPVGRCCPGCIIKLGKASGQGGFNQLPRATVLALSVAGLYFAVMKERLPEPLQPALGEPAAPLAQPLPPSSAAQQAALQAAGLALPRAAPLPVPQLKLSVLNTLPVPRASEPHTPMADHEPSAPLVSGWPQPVHFPAPRERCAAQPAELGRCLGLARSWPPRLLAPALPSCTAICTTRPTRLPTPCPCTHPHPSHLPNSASLPCRSRAMGRASAGACPPRARRARSCSAPSPPPGRPAPLARSDSGGHCCAARAAPLAWALCCAGQAGCARERALQQPDGGHACSFAVSLGGARARQASYALQRARGMAASMRVQLPPHAGDTRGSARPGGGAPAGARRARQRLPRQDGRPAGGCQGGMGGCV